MTRRSWPLRLEIAIVLIITAIALAIRVYRLADFPPGLWLDEAANGVDILEVLKTHSLPIFFARNNGREPLFIYLQTLSVMALGATPLALRLTAALVGTATVPATYWMVREAFARDRLPAQWVALWTSLFLAFSYWHISLSRLGLRAITLPLMATITFAWFWRAWHKLETREKLPWVDIILCGFFLGATLYTYTAARFVPVLLVLVAAVGVLGPGRSTAQVKRAALGVGIVAVVAAIVFAPLVNYYLTHPGSFLGHAASVTALNPEFAKEGPLVTQGRAALRTAAMFIALKDPNLRHNPAERPVFDLFLGIWLAAGLILAIVRWRTLPYFFAIAWFILLLLPAVLTVEGVPHSLRSAGVIPVACLLPVLAMLHAGSWLEKKWHALACWLPLPFLLFSAFTGVRDYFHAWKDMDNFRAPFMVDYKRLAQYIQAHDPGDVVWIMSYHPDYFFSDGTLYNFRYYVQDKIPIGAVPVDEEEAPEALRRLSQNHARANFIQVYDWTGFQEAFYDLVDPKHLVDFLLTKHGRLVKDQDDPSAGIKYRTYELPRSADYHTAGGFTPLTASFDGEVQLTEVAYGHTATTLDEPAASLDDKTVPSGHSLWAVLHWRALAPIEHDLKTSLMLRDEYGHLAGQIDNLLVSDRYPKEDVWQPGEPAGSYHILSTLPGIPPGRYSLYLKVYDSATLRPYPVVDDAGNVQGAEVKLGDVNVTRPLTTPEVTPTISLPPDTLPGTDLALLGYDLPQQTVRPGSILPITLYWQARNQPGGDYQVGVELRDRSGATVVQHQVQPASGMLPTGQWQQGDVWRDWHDVPIPATIPAGSYELVVTVNDGGHAVGEASIGTVSVAGRPRLFEAPPLALPAAASFGDAVDLLGIAAPRTLEVAPGQAISMTLAWQAQATLAEDLVRFVHLIGPDGRPVAQVDGPACDGECPASSWLPAEILVDSIRIDVPAELAPGTYSMVAGWYSPTTLKRLPAFDKAGQRARDDLITLPLQVVVSAGQP